MKVQAETSVTRKPSGKGKRRSEADKAFIADAVKGYQGLTAGKVLNTERQYRGTKKVTPQNKQHVSYSMVQAIVLALGFTKKNDKGETVPDMDRLNHYQDTAGNLILKK